MRHPYGGSVGLDSSQSRASRLLDGTFLLEALIYREHFGKAAQRA